MSIDDNTPNITPSSGFASGNGNTPNRDLMKKARESLKDRWGLAIGGILIVIAIFLPFVLAAGIIQGTATYHAAIVLQQAQQAGHPLVTPIKLEIPLGTKIIIYLLQLSQFIITGALALGTCYFLLKIARRSEAKVTMVLEGFRYFGKALLACFLRTLFILLWALLLVIPGIIAAYSYSLTFFILADDPSVTPLEAIKRSKAMMRGKKWKLFCLQFRFLGWYLLTLLTCGIGMLWLAPYYQISLAHFYDDVRSAE